MAIHPQESPPRRTILVVDDDLMVRTIVARTLESAGYFVRLAASAAAALLIIAAAPDAVDLVLTDIRMPGMNGVDLALEIHRSWPWLLIALMSGYEMPEVLSRHAEVAKLPFLQKPFGPNELLDLVKRVTARLTAAGR